MEFADVQWRDDALIEFVNSCQLRVQFRFHLVLFDSSVCVCVVHCDWTTVYW